MRSFVSERKCSKICASVSASMAAVGSSSTRISAPLRMNARASAMRCHCPPDSSWPLLNQRPSCVSYARRQRSDELGGLALRGGLAPALLILERGDVAGADVLADRQLIAVEVLEDHADALA